MKTNTTHIIKEVAKYSPANQVHMKAGEILLEMNGQQIAGRTWIDF